MASSRKFSTFGGVFTPAILTILGVIMYMRLPWIAGNAGLTLTIGIVVVAHVISVTTGLSVSSMATDKRVKAGGSYFILSRSLGLPIGGTLGLALFVGLSFSVSLYIIGFSESFLSYWGFEVDKTAIRIAGTTVLLAVTTVTFISTALAIKTQYVIMGAIAVSLVSVIVGNDLPRPEAIHYEPLPDGVPLAVLFGIFFPAVTGFEAGVSMSGDLKDPKRSIPVGTMAAIAVGLAVYIALSVFLTWRIPAEELANNPRVLLDYAWREELVVPGIWGATISSALGSILGAPRILQACAADGIGPRLFERGHGRDNEPRNALLLTFLLAFGGILIGELDVIARVVTMFFLTSYGFLNLAAAIESWVSPDFRPDFRIPRGVSLIGAVTCVVLMMQLDFLAMVGATLVMGGLYAWLKRRQLRLEGGDTWSGVWAGVVRWALGRLSRATTHERNWRPQVLALGAPGVARWGEVVAGSGGLVSHLPDEALSGRGSRWDDRAEACTYRGLPGLETNTVLLDLDEALEQPGGLRDLSGRLDPARHNLVLTRATAAPTTTGRVDVWWGGHGPNLALQLALVRSITSARGWRRRPVRFHIPVEEPAQRRRVEQRIGRWLRDARVKADLRAVAPDDVEQLAKLSADAGVTLLGLPPLDDAEAFRARALELTEGLGPCLMVRASSAFTDPIGDSPLVRAEGGAPEPAERLSADAVLQDLLTHVERGLVAGFDALGREVDAPLAGALAQARQEVGRHLETAVRHLDRAAALGEVRGPQAASLVRGRALSALDAALAHLSDEADHDSVLARGLASVDAVVDETVLGVPFRLDVTRPEAPAQGLATGVPEGGFFRKLRLWRRIHPQVDTVSVVGRGLEEGVLGALDRMVVNRIRDVLELDELVAAAADAVESPADERAADLGFVRQRAGTIATTAVQGTAQEQGARHAVARTLTREVAELVGRARRRWVPPRRAAGGDWLDVEDLSETFGGRLEVVDVLLVRTRIDLWLRRVVLELRGALGRILSAHAERVEAGLASELRAVSHALERAAAGEGVTALARRRGEVDGEGVLRSLGAALDEVVLDLPETVQVLPSGALDAAELDDVVVHDVALRRLVGFALETELLVPVREAVRALDRTLVRCDEIVGDLSRTARAIAERDPEDALVDTEELAREGLERLAQAESELAAGLDGLRSQAHDALERVRRQFQGGALVADIDAVSRFVRARERARLLSEALAWRDVVSRFATRVVVDLALRWDAGLLAVRAEPDAGTRDRPLVERLLRFRNAVAPRRSVMNTMPVFYQRAFLARTPDLEPHHEGLVARAREAVAAYDAGHHGAIVVSGAPGSGAANVVEHLARTVLADRRVVEVAPPRAAVDGVEALEAALRHALKAPADADVDAALRLLPRGSCIVVRDLDLWWRRRPGGTSAVHWLGTVVDTHAPRLLFLVQCGSASWRLLDRLGVFTDRAIGQLVCGPLDASDLLAAVLRRHRSTGLELRLDGASGPPSELALARFFVQLRDHSDGNLGAALAAWLASVVEVSDSHVSVKTPAEVRLDVLDHMPADWVAIVAALALHRRLGDDGLQAVTADPDVGAAAMSLVRAGLATRRQGVLELDRFSAAHVTRWLVSRGTL